MKKRLILITLVILLSTGTVVQTEIRAEAAATTVTVVSVAKAVLVLLAIAGVGIASGYAWDNAEEIKDSVVSGFTTWLNNHDPEYYTALMLAATNIAAGRVINTYDALFFGKLKQYTREYFGTDTSVSTSVGTTQFSIYKIAFTPDGTQYIDRSSTSRKYSYTLNVPQLVGFAFTVNGSYGAVFLPANPGYIYDSFNGGAIFDSVTWKTMSFPSKQVTVGYYSGITGSNITFLKTGISTSSVDTALAQIATKYISGGYTNVTDDVLMRPFATVGDVAATSVDATVVGAGQAITEEDNEVVIDGDRTINLSNVNIDEWLKSLAEGTQTYAQAMQAIGLAAVNTQTMTLEEVQAIAQALNPAAAGTGTITGNYTVALSDLFPFCIPFDLYNIISCFKADPVAPSAEITIPVGYDGSEFTWETYTVSLSEFDTVAAVVRVLEYIGFVIGLMLITRKLIEG